MLNHSTLVQSAFQLQPLPQTVGRLVPLMSQSEPEPDEITAIIAFDPVLTARLLRIANSSTSAPRHPISRVKDAIVRMGPGLVFSIAMGTCARPLMDQKIEGYDLSPGDLWRHSVLASLAVDACVPFCKTRIPLASFATALLHDMGKLILGRFLTPERMELLQRAIKEGGLEPYQAEMEILSLHHGEIGGVIAQHWHLPDEIVQGITHHHTPRIGGETICHVVYLANLVAHAVESKEYPEETVRKLLTPCLEVLGFRVDSLTQVIATVASDFERVNACYS